MLSNAAFNAFLKSLEEPPKHVVFILATTEKNKIIPTILSRCQIYDFKKVDSASIIKLLTNICKEKKIKFDENSLRLIAQKSDGSIRDSLSMFDRLVSFTDSNLTISDVSFNLNIIDYETYFELSSLIKLKDIPGILTKYNDIFNRGFDDVNFLTGLSRHLREVLICKLGPSDKISDLKAAIKIGAKPILVRTGYGKETEALINKRFTYKQIRKVTKVFDTLLDFVNYLED